MSFLFLYVLIFFGGSEGLGCFGGLGLRVSAGVLRMHPPKSQTKTPRNSGSDRHGGEVVNEDEAQQHHALANLAGKAQLKLMIDSDACTESGMLKNRGRDIGIKWLKHMYMYMYVYIYIYGYIYALVNTNIHSIHI